MVWFGCLRKKLIFTFYNSLFKNNLHKNVIQKPANTVEVIILTTGLKFILIYSLKVKKFIFGNTWLVLPHGTAYI